MEGEEDQEPENFLVQPYIKPRKNSIMEYDK